MRWVGLLVGFGVAVIPATGLAQDVSTLTCHDANEMTGARTMDGFDLSMVASAVKDSFRRVDAARAGDGQATFMQEWTDNRLIGEVLAVVVSCQRHPADTIDQRSVAIFNEYVVLHSQ